ncbi:3'-5' exonuclease domain-containing protein 2 [Phanerochaete sordida]|uniref:3'-5' exonuclease n=1 Tax=Phanerochaete sordida TaxID=48140 RepID=A0A9P3G498_9APHY|nr:3'-5' exonuclease domain-containing protein 2 [Phanerochaete sordida]
MSRPVLDSTSTPSSSTAEVPPPLDPAPEKPPPPPRRVYPQYSFSAKSPQTRLVYIRDLHTAERELAQFKPGPCGFDMEWRPNFYKGQRENPVALVQLANEDVVLLIQISAIRSIPSSLRHVLWNPAYIKCGVGIQGDCMKLWKDYQVNTRNCVDLALLARTVDNAHWKGKYRDPIGLSRLCETYEELSLEKGRITRSNWEAVLSGPQKQYAANDSHSGLTLYKRLFPLTLTLDHPPLPSYYSFDCYLGATYNPSLDTPETIWQPHNPFYDPGPPPELTEEQIKKREERKAKRQQVESGRTAPDDGSGNAAGGSTSGSAPGGLRHPLVQSAERRTNPNNRPLPGHDQAQRGRPKFAQRGRHWRPPHQRPAGQPSTGTSSDQPIYMQTGHMDHGGGPPPL